MEETETADTREGIEYRIVRTDEFVSGEESLVLRVEGENTMSASALDRADWSGTPLEMLEQYAAAFIDGLVQ